VNGVALVVFVIAQSPGDPLTSAFERAARGVLGEPAHIEIVDVSEDPPDAESVARAGASDGVVELTWGSDRARLHCYVSREQRWVDREISFGSSDPRGEREAVERGRLLGLAMATMYSEEAELRPTPVKTAQPPQPAAPARKQPAHAVGSPPAASDRHRPGRSLEFAGTATSGVHGTAAGVGAAAGLRLAWVGPLWSRLFVSGRTGSIAEAQATTRSLLLGGGLAFAALRPSSRFELGARVDVFASYFAASHLSEDDVAPDERSRWLPGADLVVEGGYNFAGSAGLFAGAGLESAMGRTDIYTHGQRVAVVPVLRLLGEVGFRTRF
jgi:hypothetical protein